MGRHGPRHLAVEGVNVDIAGEQAFGAILVDLELEAGIPEPFRRHVLESPGRGHKEVAGLNGHDAVDDLALEARDELLAPAVIGALGAARHEAVAGGVGEQAVPAAVGGDRDVVVVGQAVDAAQFDQYAGIFMLLHELVIEVIERAVGTTVVGDAAEHAIKLVIHPFYVTVRTGEIVRADLAVKVHADGVFAGGFLEGVRLGRQVRMPDGGFTGELRFQQRALLAVIREQDLELLTRAVVEALRALGLGVLGLILGPVIVGEHVTDGAVADHRRGLICACHAGERRHRGKERADLECCNARHDVSP